MKLNQLAGLQTTDPLRLARPMARGERCRLAMATGQAAAAERRKTNGNKRYTPKASR